MGSLLTVGPFKRGRYRDPETGVVYVTRRRKLVEQALWVAALVVWTLLYFLVLR